MGLALLAPTPALAGPPVVLAQFFEHFDDEPEPSAPPAEDPALEGLDLEGLDDGGLDAMPESELELPDAAAGEALDAPEEDVAGVVPPDFDPAERPILLEGLYERLSAAKSPGEAAPITEAIEELWAMSGSDTVDLLMSRAMQFANDSDVDLSLAVLDAVVDIAPEEAEAWYLRAKVNVLAGNPERALADLRRTLNLDEKHYRAITDLGLVLEQLGAKKEALKAYRQALTVNPYMDDAKAGVDALAREVEGQDI
ncbi:hypothetical protein AUC68_03990 [Methyloceanibacter methanicus]|uniref:Uncharacterized protein n=1 Tax=Methyloceanibacter methanicus TaxID=1774968 RepID=A0A1E3W056_9HYPH|nr:hypothetical protein AUC68_03990 [Methyloceanibacter methanicus]